MPCVFSFISFKENEEEEGERVEKSVCCVEIATWSPNEMKKKERKSQSNIGHNRISTKKRRQEIQHLPSRVPSTSLEIYWMKWKQKKKDKHTHTQPWAHEKKQKPQNRGHRRDISESTDKKTHFFINKYASNMNVFKYDEYVRCNDRFWKCCANTNKQ